MTLEDYRKLLDDVKSAQAALNACVFTDLQRLASAESNNTKAKIAEAYDQGIYEAWRMIDEIRFAKAEEVEETFGTFSVTKILDMDPKEVQTKWQEHRSAKKAKEEEKQFHVGDELESFGTKVVVIKMASNDVFNGIDKNGEIYSGRTYQFWKKTGRHFGGVENLLKEMKEQDAKN